MNDTQAELYREITNVTNGTPWDTPISRTDYRMAEWLRGLRNFGLITQEEYNILEPVWQANWVR